MKSELYDIEDKEPVIYPPADPRSAPPMPAYLRKRLARATATIEAVVFGRQPHKLSDEDVEILSHLRS